MKHLTLIASVACAALLSACGSGSVTQGNAQLPPVSSVGLGNVGKLQFAVGTAKLADGTTGLNIVTTFRQSNGDSAVLVDTPTITGPSGFSVPTTAAALKPNGGGGSGSDAGTATITSLAQGANATGSDTLGTGGGIFASGIEPFNITQGANAQYPGKPNFPSGVSGPTYGLPFYANTYDGTNPTQPFLLGPPGVPFFNDGTYPSSFAGYQTGFTPFEMAPVAGSYSLSVLVAAANVSSATYTASASLASTATLPALPQPTFTEDGAGGGTATVTVPAGSAITETIIYVFDFTQKTYYSSGALTGTGAVTFTLPDNLGNCGSPQNCENSSTTAKQSIIPGPTPGTGDTYYVYAASFDYPQFEAEPPGNKSQTPTITGSNGQADVTLSPALSATY